MHHEIARSVVALALAFVCFPVIADDLTYSNWKTAPSDWKRGYAFGFLSAQSQLVSADASEADVKYAKAYYECTAGKLSDVAYADAIDDYFVTHPDAMTQSIVAVAFKSLHDICKEYLPGEQE